VDVISTLWLNVRSSVVSAQNQTMNVPHLQKRLT